MYVERVNGHGERQSIQRMGSRRLGIINISASGVKPQKSINRVYYSLRPGLFFSPYEVFR